MFSPSPAPRRTVARRESPRGTSPVNGPIRRTRGQVAGSKPTSRFATPNVVATRAESAESPSGMDVDENMEIFERVLKTETVFAKSPELQVTFYAQLPIEVKQVLRNADVYRDVYTGDVDTMTGFALVASAETCFVWKYAQALAGAQTCYIFACPQETIPMPMSTPFHALVPYGSTREPGLILMTSTGQIRFWDNLGAGLAGGEHWTSSTLELGSEERASTLLRADPQTFIVSTSIGRLFRLTLTSVGGKYHLSPHAFSRPQSALSLSRLIPFWSSESAPAEPGNINAVALTEQDRDAPARALWVLIDFRLQRWVMSIEGWEELQLDEDIADHIRPAIRSRFDSASTNDIELDLEFLDLKIISEEQILILASYAGQEDPSAMETTPRRIYAIVRLSYSSNSFTVQSVKSVPYQSTSSSGAPTHPRIQSVLKGELVVVQFGDTVAICSRDTEYMDRLELKSSSDRTLGVGVIPGESEILVMTAATVMKAWVDTDAVAQFNPETGRANLIKSTMTQAILYGSYPENPLDFSFPPEIDEDALMSGAQQLSQAILESDTHVVRPNHDLQAQMTSRKDRLSFLIKFINDNAVLTKMSQRSRQQLGADAEKLYAAHRLWLQHNESLAAGNTRGILSEAVYLLMQDSGEGHHEDYVRAFFRLKVDDVGSLLPRALGIVRNLSHSTQQDLHYAIVQANDIALTIIQSAIDYRHFNLRVYGIELPLIRPWTSQPAIIDMVSEMFDATTKIVEIPTAEVEMPRSKVAAMRQLPELASILFSIFYERLQWLESPSASNDSAAQRERDTLEERFRQARPVMLEILRRNGFANEAFHLAEQYRDFRTLTSLCHKETVYPPEDNPNTHRIQTYIQKFKEDFTTELYRWYIEHGELRTMFAHEPTDEYLDRFFSTSDYPHVSWIHDLGEGRFGPASETLLSEAESAPELVSKHLMLSIGKLAHLAQLQEPSPENISESVLDAFHDGLDFISVHEALIDELRSALVSVRVRQPVEMQVDTIVKAKASELSDRKALQSVFKQLVRRLLQGKALTIEEAADVLSLKDNKPEVDDFVTALHLLDSAQTLPNARRLSAFRSVWRRIYIHDDWDEIRKTSNIPDAEVNDRLRNTALYAALQATATKRQQALGYVLQPSRTLEIPSLSEIGSRWPGMPPDDINALSRDYTTERDIVADLDLDETFERVRELAIEDEKYMDMS